MLIRQLGVLAMGLWLVAAEPETGRAIAVRAGQDLQAAIDSARPGDTLLLDAGATFVGNFVLPQKDGSDWITIRSAASDGDLPPAGTRIAPPDSHLLPRLTATSAGPIIRTAPGAHHWRLQELEIAGGAGGYGDMVAIGDGDSDQSTTAPHDVVIDRCYIHGDPVLGQKRGIALNGGATEIRNSYVSDCKGVGMDTQAIAAWNGPGPYLIANNYLEAAGENILIGGADPRTPGLVPSDIVIRHNYLTKPVAWRTALIASPAPPAVWIEPGGGSLPASTCAYRVSAAVAAGQGTTALSAATSAIRISVPASSRVHLSWQPVANATGYRVFRQVNGGAWQAWSSAGTQWVDTGANGETATPPDNGTSWTVKNILELKNARRVTIVGNVLEHNWRSGQSGYAVLFTVRNQDGAAPWSTIEDVDFDANIVRYAAAAINVLGHDNNHPSGQLRGLTIENSLFYGIDGQAWDGDGRFMLIGGQPADMTIAHNTISQTGSALYVYGGASGQGAVTPFRFIGNIAFHREYGVMGDGTGLGRPTIEAYFPGSQFVGNVLAGGDAGRYPSGNFFPSEQSLLAAFVNPAQNDFHLKGANALPASQGQIPGADMGQLDKATTHVTDAHAADVAVPDPRTLRDRPGRVIQPSRTSVGPGSASALRLHGHATRRERSATHVHGPRYGSP